MMLSMLRMLRMMMRIGSGGVFFAGKCNKDLGQGEGKGKGKLVVNAVAVMNMLMISVMNMDGDIGDILMKTRERSSSFSYAI